MARTVLFLSFGPVTDAKYEIDDHALSLSHYMSYNNSLIFAFELIHSIYNVSVPLLYTLHETFLSKVIIHFPYLSAHKTEDSAFNAGVVLPASGLA